MSIVAVLVSPAFVSGVAGGLVAYLSQRSLADRQARLDHVARPGPGIGIAVPGLDVPAPLAATKDEQSTPHLTDHPATLDRVLAEESR